MQNNTVIVPKNIINTEGCQFGACVSSEANEDLSSIEKGGYIGSPTEGFPHESARM